MAYYFFVFKEDEWEYGFYFKSDLYIIALPFESHVNK